MTARTHHESAVAEAIRHRLRSVASPTASPTPNSQPTPSNADPLLQLRAGPAVVKNAGEPSIGYNPSAERNLIADCKLCGDFRKIPPLGSAPSGAPHGTTCLDYHAHALVDRFCSRIKTAHVCLALTPVATSATGVLVGLNSFAVSDDDARRDPAQVNPKNRTVVTIIRPSAVVHIRQRYQAEHPLNKATRSITAARQRATFCSAR